MLCSHCGKMIPDGVKFCIHCGKACASAVQTVPAASEMKTVCPACKTAVPAGEKFCHNCGYRIGGWQQAPSAPPPVRVKRYGFLRFLLIVICLLCIWFGRKIPEKVMQARSGILPASSSTEETAVPMPENAIGENRLTEEQLAEYAVLQEGGSLTPEESPEKLEEQRMEDQISHEYMQSWLYENTPERPDKREE